MSVPNQKGHKKVIDSAGGPMLLKPKGLNKSPGAVPRNTGYQPEPMFVWWKITGVFIIFPQK